MSLADPAVAAWNEEGQGRRTPQEGQVVVFGGVSLFQFVCLVCICIISSQNMHIVMYAFYPCT